MLANEKGLSCGDPLGEENKGLSKIDFLAQIVSKEFKDSIYFFNLLDKSFIDKDDVINKE